MVFNIYIWVMKKYLYYLSGIILLIQLACTNKEEFKMNYPTLNKQIVKDSFFGEQIKDQYRNLENLNDSTTINWFESQDNLTNKTLFKISGRDIFLQELKNNNNKQKPSFFRLREASNGYIFYVKRMPDENIGKLYFRSDFSAEEELLFDPKKFDPKSKIEYKINYLQPNWDGSTIAVGLSYDDKEYAKIIAINTKDKSIYKGFASNSLPNSYGGIEWLPDNSGFIYSKISDDKKGNTESVIYKIGTSSSKVKAVFSKSNNLEVPFKNNDIPILYYTNPNSEIILGANVEGSSRYRDTYYTYIEDIENKPKWKLYYSKEEKVRNFKISDDYFYYRTAKNASNFKICRTPLTKPDFENPFVLVEEDSLAVISDFAITSKGLFYVKTKNGVEAKLFKLNESNKEFSEVKLPKSAGYINVSSKGANFEDLWVETEGWVNNRQRLKFNYTTNIFESLNLIPNAVESSLNDVVVEEIEIPSHDGTMVPLSIVYKKGTKKDKSNRLLINAYGAYKWTNSPFMYNYLLHWVKNGGIYATAHVRGGGEKGNKWYKAGFKTTKPNTWKDLIACTEYFVKNNYTTSEKIVAWGASAGGICIGRAITERPDLYAAAIIRVGVLNPMRLEFGPKGSFNTKEFGSVKDSVEYKALYEMDSYLNIKDNVEYPAVYLTAGLNDARVVAWQPGKFVARMQEASSSNKPILFSVDKKGGHGFESTKDKQNNELANIISFALWQTGHPDYQIKK